MLLLEQQSLESRRGFMPGGFFVGQWIPETLRGNKVPPSRGRKMCRVWQHGG